MSAVLKTITAEEYLARERVADFKSEFYRGEVFAMSVGSARHCLIAANFTREAGSALKGKPCRVYSSDLRVMTTPSGLVSYPDASIVCCELQFRDEKQDTLTNPTVLVEVLSESTERYDRGVKSQLYRELSSLQELVLIAQDRPRVECYRRQASGGWLLLDTVGLTDTLTLDSIGITIEMAELYRGVTFDPVTDATPPPPSS